MRDRKTSISAIELMNGEHVRGTASSPFENNWPTFYSMLMISFLIWNLSYWSTFSLLSSDAWIHSRELCTLGERIFWLNGPCWRRSIGKTHSWNAVEHVTRFAGPSHAFLQKKATAEELRCVAVREDTSLPHSTAIFVPCSWIETMAHACLTCHDRR